MESALFILKSAALTGITPCGLVGARHAPATRGRSRSEIDISNCLRAIRPDRCIPIIFPPFNPYSNPRADCEWIAFLQFIHWWCFQPTQPTSKYIHFFFVVPSVASFHSQRWSRYAYYIFFFFLVSFNEGICRPVDTKGAKEEETCYNLEKQRYNIIIRTLLRLSSS